MDELERAATDLRQVRIERDTARDEFAAATIKAKQAVISARAVGMWEHVIAQLVGVNRMTVRKWLGKDLHNSHTHV